MPLRSTHPTYRSNILFLSWGFQRYYIICSTRINVSSCATTIIFPPQPSNKPMKGGKVMDELNKFHSAHPRTSPSKGSSVSCPTNSALKCLAPFLFDNNWGLFSISGETWRLPDNGLSRHLNHIILTNTNNLSLSRSEPSDRYHRIESEMRPSSKFLCRDHTGLNMPRLESYENLGLSLSIYMTFIVAQSVAKTVINVLPNW